MTLNEFLGKAGDLFKSNSTGITPEQLSAVQTEATKLKTDLDALSTKNGELSTQLEAANIAATEAKAALETAKTQHATALEAKEKDVNARADAKFQAACASQGIKPLKADAPNKTEKQVSRAEFEAMPHAERNTFMRSGGKISQ